MLFRNSNSAVTIVTTAAIAVTSFLLGSALSYLFIHSNYDVIDDDEYEYDDDDDDDDEADIGNNDEYHNDDEKISETDAKVTTATKIYDTPELDIRLLRKAEAVIQKRTDKIIIVVERCTNDHNYSAILRTAEALGIQTICLIDPPTPTTIDYDGIVRPVPHGNTDPNIDDDGVKTTNSNDDQVEVDGVSSQQGEQSLPSHHNNSGSTNTASQKVVLLSESERRAFIDHRKFAQNATQWLTIREFSTAAECIHTLRTIEQYDIWVTDLSQEAIPLTKHDLQQCNNTYKNNKNNSSNQRSQCWPLPKKIAIVMGTEAVGCSVEMLHNANVRCYLPLHGFADSLNLSVATALVLQQIFHLHPSYIGNMSPENRHGLRQLWYPKLAQQRLMSARTKKQYRSIQKQIDISQRLQIRYNSGEVLTSEQIEKMQRMTSHQTALKELETKSQFHVSHDIVADYINHPPKPLSDLRRANIHRVTFVGKNIKKINEHHWKDMIAISNRPLPKMTTASFFRDRLVNTTNSNTNTSSS